MRSSRLLSLLLLLQTRQQLTARELATELEVSLRTIYRDVESLSAAGVPVYAEHGRAGGYRLVAGYRTSLTGLTDHETAALFMVGMPGPAAALGLAGEASAAELKLLAALAPDQRERAGRLRDRFHLDVPAWYRDAEQAPHLAAVAEAVLHDRRIDVGYRRWKEPR
ncbi:MAG: helix-turn-helix transcriptional regulator, partial [Actinomycetes bacterium]